MNQHTIEELIDSLSLGIETTGKRPSDLAVAVSFNYDFFTDAMVEHAQKGFGSAEVMNEFEQYESRVKEGMSEQGDARDCIIAAFDQMSEAKTSNDYGMVRQGILDFLEHGEISVEIDTERLYSACASLRDKAKNLSKKEVEGAQSAYDSINSCLRAIDKDRRGKIFFWRKKPLQSYSGPLSYDSIAQMIFYSDQTFSSDVHISQEIEPSIDRTVSADSHDDTSTLSSVILPGRFDGIAKRFNYKALQRGDENWLIDQYVNSKETINKIRDEFKSRARMPISVGSLYRTIDKNIPGYRRSKRNIEVLAA